VQVIHFTRGATDPLRQPRVHDAHFVQLAAGTGESRLGCIHIGGGGSLPRRSVPHDSTLLTVHGNITLIADTGLRLRLASGMGVVLSANEHFALETDEGGIMLLIQCERLEALEGGISTPDRIRGQQWPGDPAVSTPPAPR
jgi:hypothetical protein